MYKTRHNAIIQTRICSVYIQVSSICLQLDAPRIKKPHNTNFKFQSASEVITITIDILLLGTLYYTLHSK